MIADRIVPDVCQAGKTLTLLLGAGRMRSVPLPAETPKGRDDGLALIFLENVPSKKDSQMPKPAAARGALIKGLK